MRKPIYPYRKCNDHLYEFVSVGKANVIKNVEFARTETAGVVNLGFGDLLETGELDDTINSNNADLSKVMATIVSIIEQYTSNKPELKIIFEGSTPQRTRLYGRILQTYYQEFTVNFTITAIATENLEEVPFDPTAPYTYKVYIIQRIS